MVLYMTKYSKMNGIVKFNMFSKVGLNIFVVNYMALFCA
jgi:hypothetical protein